MDRVLIRYLSRHPDSASLWADVSPVNVAVIAVITSHVVELVNRAGVLGMIWHYTREVEPARQERCPCC
jgi:hypothetical protein